jgi:hypothetical protein
MAMDEQTVPVTGHPADYEDLLVDMCIFVVGSMDCDDVCNGVHGVIGDTDVVSTMYLYAKNNLNENVIEALFQLVKFLDAEDFVREHEKAIEFVNETQFMQALDRFANAFAPYIVFTEPVPCR